MKSSSYYDRKAWDLTNCGKFDEAKRMRRMARKARRIKKKKENQ